MRKKHRKTASWGFIVAFSILLPPLGIYLWIRKVFYEKYAYYQNGRHTVVMSVFIGLVAVFFTVIGAAKFVIAGREFGLEQFFPIIMTLVIWSLVYFFTGSNMIKTGIKYAKYVKVINNRSDNSLDNIATFAGVTFEQTCTDLNQMIEDGYFQNAKIDKHKRLFIPFAKE